MKFNEILREIRKNQRLTQRNVYEKLNVSPNCYASWEQGRTQPDVESIKKLCVIFDVSADSLLGLDDESEQTRLKNELFIKNRGKRP